MKGYISDVLGGPERLKLTELVRPSPGPSELLVKVAAVGVNRVDAMQRSGIYPPPPNSSDILGVECACEVVAHGPGAEVGPSTGTRVIALVPAGAYAEYVAVKYTHVVETPDGWSEVLDASVIETFCTAHETMFQLGQLKAGEVALIHAAGSAVGTTAIQIARLRGAEVVSTAGSDEKVVLAEQNAAWSMRIAARSDSRTG